MRLIDADALLEDLKKTGRYFQAKFDIENAPTVVRTDRPCVIINDMVIYITQGHIDALIEYEKAEMLRDITYRMINEVKENEN